MRDCVTKQVRFEIGPEDQAFDIARYNLNLLCKVTYKLDTADGTTMLVTDRFAMLRANISKNVVLGLQQEVFCVLSRYMVVLCQKPLDFV